MKRTQKLTPVQLRNIILSEVKKQALTEMPGKNSGKPSKHQMVHSAVEFAFQDALDGMFNPDDPSMADGGEAKWGEQTSAATNEFINEVFPIIDRVVNRLTQGEFFTFSPNKGRLGR